MIPIERISEDIEEFPIVLIAKRGHGKSSSLKTILKRIIEDRELNGESLILKVFDISQSWYWNSPTKYRQRVTLDTIKSGRVENIGDCSYEIGELSKDDRRSFVASILSQDYTERYQLGIRYGADTLKGLPLILYIFEEASTYFDTYSLRRSDIASKILNDFISVGRNYGLNGVFVVNRMNGELSTGVRERSALLIGRISGDGELSSLRRSTNKRVRELAQSIPKYHWVYFSGYESEPFRVRDEVNHRPEDYNKIRKPITKSVKELIAYLTILGSVLIVTYPLISLFSIFI